MIESRTRVQTPPRTNGHPTNGAASVEIPPDEEPKKRRSLRKYTVPAIVVTLVPVLLFSLLFAYEQLAYVVTDNAQVSGSLAQVGPTVAGQVRSIAADVGDEVPRGRVLGNVLVSATQSVALRAPFDGIVVARYANPGDILTAGKTVFTVLDPNDLWVEARVEEGQAVRVRPGQKAEVTFDAVGHTVSGRVSAVGGASLGSLNATAATQTFASGRPRQFVPVRIDLDEGQAGLVYGGLASVKILTR